MSLHIIQPQRVGKSRKRPARQIRRKIAAEREVNYPPSHPLDIAMLSACGYQECKSKQKKAMRWHV